MRPDTLADAIDMVTRFNENFACIQEICKKKGLVPPLTKFKKAFFRGPQKPPCRSL